MEALQTEQYNDYIIKVYPDFNAENPILEDGTLGEYYSWDNRHNWGNMAFKGTDELKQYIQRRKCFVFSWFVYSHSGVAFSLVNKTYPFNDHWDAWQCGMIVVPITKAKQTFGKSVSREQVKEVIESELEVYQRYVNGDVYYITVEDENGETIDSCGGIFDIDGFIEELKLSLNDSNMVVR